MLTRSVSADAPRRQTHAASLVAVTTAPTDPKASYCNVCHDFNASRAMVEFARLTLDVPSPRLPAAPVAGYRLASTQICVACHQDQGKGLAEGASGAGRQLLRGRTEKTGHPVEFHYDDLVARYPKRFRQRSSVSGLRWYALDGRDDVVGCGTCHDTHHDKGFRWMLRLDYEADSALCTQCHIVAD